MIWYLISYERHQISLFNTFLLAFVCMCALRKTDVKQICNEVLKKESNIV